MTNMVRAFVNALALTDNKILEFYEGKVSNRANSMGDALEYYVKDLFCGSLNASDGITRDKVYSQYFSYLGNSNNPPDFIIKGSSAVEVKKVENLSFGDVPLNSSYPKDLLHSSSTLLNKECRDCEETPWDIKEMVYAIGNVPKGASRLRMLWLTDGECYSASKEVYERMKNTIKDGIEEIQGVEFSETNELGKVHKVDPLGITNLRIRGMWNIKHPMKVYDYLVGSYDKSIDLQVYCLLLEAKYDKLPKEDKESVEKAVQDKKCTKTAVEIKDPNNPAKWLKAILLKADISNTAIVK